MEFVGFMKSHTKAWENPLNRRNWDFQFEILGGTRILIRRVPLLSHLLQWVLQLTERTDFYSFCLSHQRESDGDLGPSRIQIATLSIK